MESFKGGRRDETDAFRRNTAEARSREALEARLAGRGQESVALAKDAQAVANELFETCKKLMAWPLSGNGGSTREGQFKTGDYLALERRKEDLRRRYEALLGQLEEAGHVTTVRRLRKRLNEAEEVLRRTRL